MYSENTNSERILRNLLEAIDSCRAGVLDTFELELGADKNWKIIRARLLRSFGDRGLTGRIVEILDSELVGRDDK